MKKFKIYIYILMLLPTLLLQSCLKDQEDVFDEPSAVRMQKTLEDVKKVLTSSENGWAFDYFPDRNITYGGYEYAVKFDSLSANIYFELAPGQSETSLYKLKSDDGPVLSFDSYNQFMHFFATPSSSKYEAYDGDFEFVIDSLSNDLVKLHGKRSQNVMYLRKISEDCSSYMSKTIANSNQLLLSSLTGSVGTTSVAGSFDLGNRHLSLTYKNSTGNLQTFDGKYVFTANGIRLYEPLNIGGKTVMNFTYNDDDLSLKCTDADATDVVLKGFLPVAYVKSAIGKETITLSDDAFTTKYTLNHNDIVTYLSCPDWVTLSKEGKSLKLTCQTNNTGHIRNGYLKYSIGQNLDSLKIVQCDFDKDISGSYRLYFTDDGNQDNYLVKITSEGITFDGQDWVMPITYNSDNCSISAQSGQYIGTVISSKGIMYYLYSIFVDNNDSYWSGYGGTGGLITAPFTYDEKSGTYAVFSGKAVQDGDFGSIWFYAYSEKSQTKNTAKGSWARLGSPYLVKVQ